MARNDFISWYKMFVRLESVFEAASNEAAGRALKASFVYARTGTVPDLDPVSMILFSSIRPSIDESAETFENISKRNRENIKKRWADTSKENPKKRENTKQYQSIPTVPDDTEDRSKKIEVRSKKIEDRERWTASPSISRACAKPPTEDEAIEFFGTEGSSTQEAKRFYDYYTANGWKVGKNSMKDWKAAARNWIRRAGEYAGTGRQPTKAESAQNALDVLNNAANNLNNGIFPKF